MFGPFAEEVLFRGYLFRQLYRRAGWSFIAAVAVSAIFFGLAHVRNVIGKGDLRLLVSEIVITGVGGAFFAWLFVNWRDNLWVPFTVHSFMNLWWEVFLISQSAVGNRVGIVSRSITIILVVAITLRQRRAQPRPVG